MFYSTKSLTKGFLEKPFYLRLSEPDLFRLRHRNLIISTMGEIICTHMNKLTAVAAIKKRASELFTQSEQSKFVETIETELMSPHKGNIARFRLRPSEYDEWLKTWI